MTSKVTVLTTVYNTNLLHLKECIESILNQTYKDFEYLIIDDNSTDLKVSKLIESYQDKRIIFHRNVSNLGVSETINKALSMTDSKYIVRADHDDISSHDRVLKQIDYLESNPELSAICSWEITIDGKGKKIRSWESNIDNYGEFLGPVLLGLSPIWHPSIAFKREDVVSIGGFNKKYIRAEDGELTTRLALMRYSAAIIPEYLVFQRNHGSNQTNTFNKEMIEMKNLIHFEAINKFLPLKEAKELGPFLRMEKNISFNKKHVLKMETLINILFLKVEIKQKLSQRELNSLKRIIFRRIGIGIPLLNFYRLFPSALFMFIFFLFSPLYLKSFYEIISKSYHLYRRAIFFFFKRK